MLNFYKLPLMVAISIALMVQGAYINDKVIAKFFMDTLHIFCMVLYIVFVCDM